MGDGSDFPFPTIVPCVLCSHGNLGVGAVGSDSVQVTVVGLILIGRFDPRIDRVRRGCWLDDQGLICLLIVDRPRRSDLSTIRIGHRPCIINNTI